MGVYKNEQNTFPNSKGHSRLLSVIFKKLSSLWHDIIKSSCLKRPYLILSECFICRHGYKHTHRNVPPFLWAIEDPLAFDLIKWLSLGWWNTGGYEERGRTFDRWQLHLGRVRTHLQCCILSVGLERCTDPNPRHSKQGSRLRRAQSSSPEQLIFKYTSRNACYWVLSELSLMSCIALLLLAMVSEYVWQGSRQVC